MRGKTNFRVINNDHGNNVPPVDFELVQFHSIKHCWDVMVHHRRNSLHSVFAQFKPNKHKIMANVCMKPESLASTHGREQLLLCITLHKQTRKYQENVICGSWHTKCLHVMWVFQQQYITFFYSIHGWTHFLHNVHIHLV